MDYRTMALAVCNGTYTVSTIAMALHVLDMLGASKAVSDDIRDMLYALKDYDDRAAAGGKGAA